MSYKADRGISVRDFFCTDPIPDEGMKAVHRLLQSGELFRYIGESSDDSEVALLERDFAQFVGTKYALAVNSCSSALFLALIALGIRSGDKVLIPAFTFVAVPSSVVHAGAIPVLVECDQSYRVDLQDLKNKIHPDIKAFVLSHMRGHTSDLDAIRELCDVNGIKLIEDAAHSIGVRWNDKPVGTIGDVGCFSFQSYKLLNGGEGGILATDSEELIVRAVYLSGAYEKNWKKHFGESVLFETYQNMLPLYNLRMSNLSAAAVRSQIGKIGERVKRGLHHHKFIASLLSASPHIHLPQPDHRECPAPDSIQFNLIDCTDAEVIEFVSKVREQGVSLYVFGFHEDNARVFWNWHFLGNIPDLPQTRAMLMRACDMRLPLSFSTEQLYIVADIITTTIKAVKAQKVTCDA